MAEKAEFTPNAEVWGEALRDEKRYAIALIVQVSSPQGGMPVPTCHSVWEDDLPF